MPQKKPVPELSVEELDRYIKNAKNYSKTRLIEFAHDRMDVVYPPQTKKPQLVDHVVHTAQFIRDQLVAATSVTAPS